MPLPLLLQLRRRSSLLALLLAAACFLLSSQQFTSTTLTAVTAHRFDVALEEAMMGFDTWTDEESLQMHDTASEEDEMDEEASADEEQQEESDAEELTNLIELEMYDSPAATTTTTTTTTSSSPSSSPSSSSTTDPDHPNPGFIAETRFDPSSREKRVQLRRVVSDKPTSHETHVGNYTATFTFVSSRTSDGYTFETKPELTIEELAKRCYEDIRCTGFTSLGEMKTFVRPASKWSVINLTGSKTVNVALEVTGLYYHPQWYRFAPVPCPCGTEVPLNYVCSDPASGDQYLGDPLTDASCYREKPIEVKHACPAKTCVDLKWTYKPFDQCPTCGRNVTMKRPVTCTAKEGGTIYPNSACTFIEAQPPATTVCNSDVECTWLKIDGECEAPCGRGFKKINVTCISPQDSTRVPDAFCTTTKPRTVRKCRVRDCIWNTVPEGECSFSCGDGHKSLKVTCIEPGKPEAVLNDQHCAGVKRPSVLVKCTNRACTWDTKPTSPCSQPCGRGEQSVSNTCRDPLTGDIMPSKQCNSEPPPSKQPCTLRSCKWETTPFGGCSNSCGAGTQYFNVTCRDPVSGHRVDDVQCKKLKVPPTPQAPCENNACGWKSRPVGECSAVCGDGTQEFKVTCEDPLTGALLPDSQCGSHKPNTTQSCHIRECHWHRAMKGQCSSPCGPGIQAYTLTCRDPSTGTDMKKSACKHVPVPSISEPCFQHACEWHVAAEGKCDQICGPGKLERKVTCHDPVSATRVPIEQCEGQAPSSITPCYSQACVWSTKPTSECSVTCGTGKQNVNVTCTDPHHRFVLPDTQCFSASKPSTQQVCNQQACRWKSTPLQSCSSSCGVGTQPFNVQCIDPTTQVEQAKEQCDEDLRPKDATKCFLKPCAWVRSETTTGCSEICGPGESDAKVTCQDPSVGTIYSDSLCAPEPKPSGKQPCQTTECKWVKEWSTCNVKCGGDFQFAQNMTCQHPDGRVVSNTQCRASPPTWRLCGTDACPTAIEEAFLYYSFSGELAGSGAKIKNRVSTSKKYGLNGLVQGDGTTSVSGPKGRGQAISFPSSSDHSTGPYIVIPPGTQLTSPSFSLSLWMQLLTTPTAGRFYIIIDNRGINGGGEGYVIYLDPRDGFLYLNDAYSAQLGRSHFADSGIPFPQDGKYHHISVTYNQKLVKFFIDGVQTSSVDPSHTFTFTINISQHSVYLRGSPDKYWRYLPMNLDEFAYFSYPLKGEQVKLLATVGTLQNVCASGSKLTGGGCLKLKYPGDILTDRCGSSGPPYSLQKCLEPLWGIEGCDRLSTSYPSEADIALWNSQPWKDIVRTVDSFAKRDIEPQSQAKKSWGTCKNRTPSGLDFLCDHPPPYHQTVCLQGLFLEYGCSRNSKGFPSSNSHPLARQLNELTWRDVKMKIKSVIEGDTKGGKTEGMCHDNTPDLDAQ